MLKERKKEKNYFEGHDTQDILHPAYMLDMDR